MPHEPVDPLGLRQLLLVNRLRSGDRLGHHLAYLGFGGCLLDPAAQLLRALLGVSPDDFLALLARLQLFDFDVSERRQGEPQARPGELGIVVDEKQRERLVPGGAQLLAARARAALQQFAGHFFVADLSNFFPCLRFLALGRALVFLELTESLLWPSPPPVAGAGAPESAREACDYRRGADSRNRGRASGRLLSK